MRTLVIHPHDRSTHFLKPIYEEIPDKTVVTGGLTSAEMERLILIHNRVIMLGHGSPSGLFGLGFKRTYVISEREVELLRNKECIFIWCHANEFVNEYNLNGFHSGMFVSEVGEALMYGLKGDKKLINESNDEFAYMLGSVINKPMIELYESVKKEYGYLADRNEIAKYNHERLMLV